MIRACAAVAAALLLAGAAGPATAQTQPAAAAATLRAGIVDLGTTRRLEILPLVDWSVARPDLRGEAGVSYLVRTDRSTLLFDVGGNLERSDPSPLVANMRALGVRLEDIDTIVISHVHMDHVGGQANAQARTFSLDARQVDLSGKRVFVPAPMTYPGLQPQVTGAPAVLAPGVATTGPLTGRIALGLVDEQALAIRVEGRGIVLVVGCGHQGLAPLLERTAALFDEPLFGIVGGLHYPVPAGRWTMNGVDVQRWASYGFGAGPSPEDVQREIDTLAARGPKWVSLSPHDSSDEMIARFRTTFGARYRDLKVGEVQDIGAAAP